MRRLGVGRRLHRPTRIRLVADRRHVPQFILRERIAAAVSCESMATERDKVFWSLYSPPETAVFPAKPLAGHFVNVRIRRGVAGACRLRSEDRPSRRSAGPSTSNPTIAQRRCATRLPGRDRRREARCDSTTRTALSPARPPSRENAECCRGSHRGSRSIMKVGTL